MPRFGTRSLLVAFAVAAVWLSTFGGYWAAQDVRRSVLLLILIASASLAIYSRGRRRAFWSAFAIVMFVCGGLSYERPLYRYVPDFIWIDTLSAVNTPPVISPYFSYVPTTPQPVYPSQTVAPTTPPADSAQSEPSPFGAATPAPAQPTLNQLTLPTPNPPAVYQAAAPAPAGLTIREAISDTFAAAWTLALAAIAGFIAAFIFTQQPISAGDSRGV